MWYVLSDIKLPRRINVIRQSSLAYLETQLYKVASNNKFVGEICGCSKKYVPNHKKIITIKKKQM